MGSYTAHLWVRLRSRDEWRSGVRSVGIFGAIASLAVGSGSRLSQPDIAGRDVGRRLFGQAAAAAYPFLS